MKRIALLACAGAAAAAFAAPATAAPEVCDPHGSILRCVKDLLGSTHEICVPSGDLEDDCRLGG